MNAGQIGILHLILVIWVAPNVCDFLMLFLISSFVVTTKLPVTCALFSSVLFSLEPRIKHLSSGGSSQTMVGCSLNICTALVDNEEDGTTAEELEEAIRTKVAFACRWILVSPLIN